MRSETSKDKAGALPPAVYQMAPQAIIPGQCLDFDGKADDTSDDHYPNERGTGDEAQVPNGANTATNVTAHGVADILFVNYSEIGGVQMDEFELDSDDEEDVYLGSDDESEVSSRGVSSSQRDKIRATRSSFCALCVMVCFINSCF